MRVLPNDNDLMQLTLDDVRSLQTRLQQELSKLTIVNLNLFVFKYICLCFFLIQIEQGKSNNTQQASPASISTSAVAPPPTTATTSSSPHQRHHKHNSSKHVLVSSSSKH